jgi:hypothetical protein
MNYSIGTRRKILSGDTPQWIINHTRCTRLIKLILATPDWVDRKAMRYVELHAQRLRCQVDHIVPIDHPLVCGLNVPWNLRIISRLENAQRSNRWWEYTPDMFAFPQQLPLL